MKVAAEAHTPSAIVRIFTVRESFVRQSIALIPEWKSPPSDRMKMRISGLM
jgi:hypothetical protein